MGGAVQPTPPPAARSEVTDTPTAQTHWGRGQLRHSGQLLPAVGWPLGPLSMHGGCVHLGRAPPSIDFRPADSFLNVWNWTPWRPCCEP